MTLQMTPQDTVRVKVTYNDKTIFEQDLEGGKSHDLTIETPKVTGEAKTYFVIDGEDVLVAIASYTFDEEPEGDGEGATGADGKAE